MVTGFYAALAGAASVFIGILTALLVSNFSNRHTEQSQILHRIKAIDSQLESLDGQREELEDQIDDINWAMEKEDLEKDAQIRVRQFIDEYVEEEYSPDSGSVDLGNITEAFAEYEGIEVEEVQTDEFLTDELEDRLDEIRHKAGVTSDYDEAYLQPSHEQVAQRQINIQRRIHLRDQHNNFQNRWHQTKTDIQGLFNERAKLQPRYDALDEAETGLLLPIVVAIISSVVIPLVAYWLRISGVVIMPGLQPWVEPAGIFIIWLLGLGIVFNHIRGQLDEDGGDLPDEPEVSLDEGDTR